ncbi:MAG TPA: NAD-dependent epimerase/dehydratase family protein [Stellaceae bacterium]|nr:NAD-dependent epimerase/dehydratase family protein [Stellaceae bacterium]
MSILVTGGAGFIGRYIVEGLVASGTRAISYNRDYIEAGDPGVHAVQGELYDLPKLVRVFREEEVAAVIHTAGMSHPEISIDLPITTFTANVEGTLHLFEAARMAGLRRIVNFSSECVYGNREEPIDESAAPRPNTPYAVTKVTTELLGDVYSTLYGLDVISLRLTEVYAPGLRMPEILKGMVATIARGAEFSLAEGRDHRFHFIHAEDAARAALLAARVPTPRARRYNISGGRQLSVGELAALVQAMVPKARIRIGPGYLTNWDRQGPLDITAAARDLGFTPRWTLEAGITQLLNHFLSQTT